ncbi:MAG: DUF4345 domain-containing protein [Anaerolineales bacterium]|nr:MAG: DUF4345 domain-containing protein [Anaerolineales bacterium]
MIVPILQYLGCILTVLVGLFSLLAPERIVSFTGLSPQGGRGITEIRSVLGGMFIALGILPFFLGNTAFTVLGIVYLAIGLVRLPSIVIDKSGTQSNWISLVFELVFGVILIL